MRRAALFVRTNESQKEQKLKRHQAEFSRSHSTAIISAPPAGRSSTSENGVLFRQLSAIARPRTALPQPSGNHRAEFQHPATDALVGEVDPMLRKQLLNVAIAQREAQVEPNRMLNHGRRETVPAIRDRKCPPSLRPVGGHGQVVLPTPRCLSFAATPPRGRAASKAQRALSPAPAQ
jgi:hypothetical protein